jgi:hypothetical protein
VTGVEWVGPSRIRTQVRDTIIQGPPQTLKTAQTVYTKDCIRKNAKDASYTHDAKDNSKDKTINYIEKTISLQIYLYTYTISKDQQT